MPPGSGFMIKRAERLETAQDYLERGIETPYLSDKTAAQRELSQQNGALPESRAVTRVQEGGRTSRVCIVDVIEGTCTCGRWRETLIACYHDHSDVLQTERTQPVGPLPVSDLKDRELVCDLCGRVATSRGRRPSYYG